MNVSSTVAAISTAQGTGGIAVIRISGEQAIEIADKVFVSVSGRKLSQLSGYSAAYGHVCSGNEKIDEAVATVFRAPHSYTGENVVEISCHGGIFLTAQVLRAVLDAGAAPAEPGEFTKRAFLNGKLDLTGAEAVMELIGAKSKTAARAALSLREGALSKKISEINGGLLNAAAHLSAWADYPEEDIAEVDPDELLQILTNSAKKLETLLSSYDSGQAVTEGIDTVIAGRPNVGKSTLMNLLSGREKSIVTDIPGTTRDIIEETVALGNVILKISDTAGLRETDNEVEKIGVELARKRLKTCGLAIAVFDISEPLRQEDTELLEIIKDIPSVAVVNKTDLPAKANTDIIKNAAKNYVEISAADDKGIERLTDIIVKLCGTEDFDPSQAILANERQRRCAADALESIKEASTALVSGLTYDAVTVSLEYAIDSLLSLTGEKTTDAVIDRVFHNFCVGK